MIIPRINTLSINQTRVFYGVIALSCVAVVLGLLAHMEVVKGVGEGSTIMMGGGGVGAAFLLILGVCKYRQYLRYQTLENAPWGPGRYLPLTADKRREGWTGPENWITFGHPIKDESGLGLDKVDKHGSEAVWHPDPRHVEGLNAALKKFQESALDDYIDGEHTKGEILSYLYTPGTNYQAPPLCGLEYGITFIMQRQNDRSPAEPVLLKLDLRRPAK